MIFKTCPIIKLLTIAVIFSDIYHTSIGDPQIQSQNAIKSYAQLNANINNVNLSANQQISQSFLDQFRNDLNKLQYAITLNEISNQKIGTHSIPTLTGNEMRGYYQQIPTESSMLYSFINYFNTMSYLSPQTITNNLQNSLIALKNASQELIPIVGRLALSSQSLPKLISGDIPSSAMKLLDIVTNDLPKIAYSLPDSGQQLAIAVSKLRNNITDIPQISKNTTTEAIMNLPKDAKDIISSISSLQTLVMDTIPKTAMIAGTAAQTSVSNIRRISETLELLTSAAQHLPKTVQNLQSTITSFNQLVQKFPETNQLPQELVDQLKTSLTKLPDIIKALPGNLKSITNVVTNLESTISSAPTSIQKTVGVLPVIGGRDPSEALDRIRLREMFDIKLKGESKAEVPLGKSLVDSLNGSQDEAGVNKLAQNLALSLRTTIAALQGNRSRDFGVLALVKPLVQSVKSFLDVVENMRTTNKFIPRATLDPLLNLINTMTASVSKM